MPSHVKHFEASTSTQDRIKAPAGFWTWLKSLGLSPGTVLRRANLPATYFREEQPLTTVQLFALWEAIRELSKNPALGWEIMHRLPTDQYPPTFMAALHARDYRDCIERLARYKRLCGAQEFRITTRGAEVQVEILWPFARGAVTPVLVVDSMFALVMELGRRGTKSNLNAKRVELTRERDGAARLGEYFGCPVKFRASRDVLVLRASDYELPFATHNEELLQMLAVQFEAALGAKAAKQGILDQVKWVLRRLLAGSRPDLAMVAKELGMGERTLQRRITDEGTTFRIVLNETRQELVRQYLADHSVEITEVAFMVGFEDANSFYRAFRAWEGKTPAEWRADNRGGPER